MGCHRMRLPCAAHTPRIRGAYEVTQKRHGVSPAACDQAVTYPVFLARGDGLRFAAVRAAYMCQGATPSGPAFGAGDA